MILTSSNTLENKEIIDYKGLCGDASDNIKGIKGIGEKGQHAPHLHVGDSRSEHDGASCRTSPGRVSDARGGMAGRCDSRHLHCVFATVLLRIEA